MKRKYKHSFEKVVFRNRWSLLKYQRCGDWVIIGIQKWWFSPTEYEYRIGFFGFDCRIWMKRTFIDK